MKVLIISPSEISYNPRLLKAADYLSSQGAEVTVFNTLIGLSSEEVYRNCIDARPWKIIENDIRKKGIMPRLRWMVSGLVQKSSIFLKTKFRKDWLFLHFLNKGFVLFPRSLKRAKFGYILIHLVDTLPLAVKLKQRTGARIIYDCQEYFQGQYMNSLPMLKTWVREAEQRGAGETDIVLSTTNVMLEKLKLDYEGPKAFIRVRNLPLLSKVKYQDSVVGKMKLVWHGLTIVPENARGIHIILQALANCKTPVQLFLQGNITEDNNGKLNDWLTRLNITDRVFVLPPVSPDNIVNSLLQYDIGIAGELAAEDNQRLTSSNKMFEFVVAGLVPIVPDLPGLAESIHELGVGILYEQGNFIQLAEIVDDLNRDRKKLDRYKQASRKVAENGLSWEQDYDQVWKTMKLWNQEN